MYNKDKFLMVEVSIERADYASETLVEDLINWTEHLYLVEDGEIIRYKGLLPKKEVEDIRTLAEVSPYGGGYEIIVEGLNICDHRTNRYFRKA